MVKKTNSPSYELDSFDRSILKILQLDNTTPQRDISKKINLSAAAVNRRIKRLHQSGVIQSSFAVLNPAKVGNPLTLVVEVEVENEQTSVLDKTKKRFLTTPEVQQCYYVTGTADFILIISVKTMEEYGLLTQQLFFADKNVKSFKTFVAMERVKVGMGIAIE